jgi:hypothetical protein
LTFPDLGEISRDVRVVGGQQGQLRRPQDVLGLLVHNAARPQPLGELVDRPQIRKQRKVIGCRRKSWASGFSSHLTLGIGGVSLRGVVIDAA